MNPILQNLISDEFSVDVGFELPTPAMYKVLQSTPEFEKVQVGLRNDIIGRGEIQEFVDALMTDFQPGRHFGHSSALMLLAVALEQHHRDFAEAYLRHLSNLGVSGLQSASRMAEYCLSNRGESVSNTFHETSLGHGREPSGRWEAYVDNPGTQTQSEDKWAVE